MAITYLKAKKLLSKYYAAGGRCFTAEGVDDFVREVLQYLLYQGTTGNLRQFIFYAKRGCITLPYELETPLKVRIENVVGNVFTSFFSYHTNMRMDDCVDAGQALYDDPNLYPTVYDVPECGGYPGILASCSEASNASVIIKGEDLTGREIFSTWRGEQITGVKLTPTKGKVVSTGIKFGKITEVIKDQLNGYLQLYSLDDNDKASFLADYSPVETTPQYRRMRLRTKPCPEQARVSILGRIRLKPFYADEDLIPFDNFYALSVAGQAINSNYNGDPQTASAKGTILEGLIEKEGQYKKPTNGQPLEISPLTAGAHIRNVVGGPRNRFRNIWRGVR